MFYRFFDDCDHYGGFCFKNTHYTEDIRFACCEELGKDWKVPKIFIEGRPSKRKRIALSPPDLGELCGGILLNDNAWDLLEPLIAKSVETYSVKTPYGDYQFAHVTKEIDCLDEKKSIGEAPAYDRYALKKSKLRSVHLFKIPQTKIMEMIVSEKFKQVVRSNGLTNAVFEPIPE